MDKFDTAIIGGGVIGISIALKEALRKRGSVVLIEKEEALGRHTSTRNSSVVHSGINQKPGTIKADVCIKGSRELLDYARNRIPIDVCGTFVVARSDSEVEKLRICYEHGLLARVPNLRLISGEEFKEHEPNAHRKDIRQVLHSPNGAIIDTNKLVECLEQDARTAGVEIFTGNRVLDIKDQTIFTSRGEFKTRHIVNAAGLYADKIAHMMDVGLDYAIIPFRGEYVSVPVNLNSMVYHPPSNSRFPFLGVHLTKTLEGLTIAGPTALPAIGGREAYTNKDFEMSEAFDLITSRQFWYLIRDKDFPRLALENFLKSVSPGAFLEEVRGLVNEDIANSLSKKDLKHYRAGNRAQLVDRDGSLVLDYRIVDGKNSTHILNAISPGMTSCLSFAEYIVNRLPSCKK